MCVSVSADSQNVMTTRSGLVIRTVPTLRPSASQTFNLKVDAEMPQYSEQEWHKSSQLVRYKSMSHLSFVTRFHLIQNGTMLDVFGNPQDTEDWTEGLPLIYQKDRYACRDRLHVFVSQSSTSFSRSLFFIMSDIISYIMFVSISGMLPLDIFGLFLHDLVYNMVLSGLIIVSSFPLNATSFVLTAEICFLCHRWFHYFFVDHCLSV